MPYNFADTFSNNFMGMYQFNQQKKLDQQRLAMEKERVGFDRDRTQAAIAESELNMNMNRTNMENAAADRNWALSNFVEIAGQKVPVHFSPLLSEAAKQYQDDRDYEMNQQQFEQTHGLEEKKLASQNANNNFANSLAQQELDNNNKQASIANRLAASSALSAAYGGNEFSEAAEIVHLWNAANYRGAPILQRKVESLKKSLLAKVKEFSRFYPELSEKEIYDSILLEAGKNTRGSSSGGYFPANGGR